MVSIFSDKIDKSTADVMEWLDYYNCEYNVFLTDDSKSIDINFEELDKDILGKVFWVRKLQKNSHRNFIINSIHESSYESSYWLNNAKDIYLDKSTQLIMAKKSGLNIPKTLISSNKQSITNFVNYNKTCIIKNYINTPIKKEDNFYNFYTQRIKIEDIDELPENIYIIQKEIEKEYEVRAFYLDGDFYSMAIFSQNDEQTTIDYRRYNNLKPNRTVPYEIPEKLKNKIQLFMSKTKLKSGSIDLIKSRNKEYYFLEVNPFGQFNMVSYPCNYNLEKKIALLLIKEHEKRK